MWFSFLKLRSVYTFPVVPQTTKMYVCISVVCGCAWYFTDYEHFRQIIRFHTASPDIPKSIPNPYFFSYANRVPRPDPNEISKLLNILKFFRFKCCSITCSSFTYSYTIYLLSVNFTLVWYGIYIPPDIHNTWQVQSPWSANIIEFLFSFSTMLLYSPNQEKNGRLWERN